MKLRIFNPEHDIALATHTDNFTAPHAARHLRASLGFIPAFWADDGDLVLVDDSEAAAEAVRHMRGHAADVRFVTRDDLALIPANDIEAIDPWGWDSSLCYSLRTCNEGLARLMPDSHRLDLIRTASNRMFAATHLLPQLRSIDRRLTGESCYCATADELSARLRANGRSVLKAPWSSSGRGIRYVEREPDDNVMGWCRNIMERQGGIMAEPFYPKAIDFGMEFWHYAGGNTEYRGLSLFDTRNGAYCGNILATEADKRDMLAQYADMELVDKVRDSIIGLTATLLGDWYEGAFGIDMMAVTGDDGKSQLIHPCVEMNLRRTMGHVALALSPDEHGPQGLMRIYASSGKYKLRVSATNDNLLDTGLV